MTNEKLITELTEFLTDVYIEEEDNYYCYLFDEVFNFMHDDRYYVLKEENPELSDEEIEEKIDQEFEEIDPEYVKSYISQYLLFKESWSDIVSVIGKKLTDRFLEENSNFEVDDDDRLIYYSPVGIDKHIQLRFEHPNDFYKTVRRRHYVWRKRLSESTAYSWLMEDNIFKYFKELHISDSKVFNDLFDDVYYDLCEAGQLYRKYFVKF
jgi:hypothetical protein